MMVVLVDGSKLGATEGFDDAVAIGCLIGRSLGTLFGVSVPIKLGSNVG
jgi:hypothetical protein